MVLSQKSQYAVRAVFELAKQHGSGPVTAGRIAALQHIPIRFLENILSELRQSGIVDSVRGKEGGYRLRGRPREVAVGDVIRVIQGAVSTIECAVEEGPNSTLSDLGGGPHGSPRCPLRPDCVLLPLWDRAHRAMMDVFDRTTFDDLIEQQRIAGESEVIDYAI